MKTLIRLLAAAVLSAALTSCTTFFDQGPKKVLVFTKSSGFVHEAINDDGKPHHGYAFRVLTELGAKNKIEFVYSKDGSLFTPEYLAQFDAFIFYTTGNLTTAHDLRGRGDNQPVMTAAGKAALLDAVAHGKGFVGIHSATDTFHVATDDDTGPRRWNDDGDRADPYIKMLGGGFIHHGDQQKTHLIVADPKFPGLAAVPSDFGPHEEWYSLKNFAPDLHVLLVQDTADMKGAVYARPPYPSTWARRHGKGRVFYTNLGHREDVWDNPVFQSMLLGGINWALRRVDADLTPNLDQVAPQARVLPKYVPPPPPKPKADAKNNP